MNRLVLRLEGLAVLAISVYFYGAQDFSWLFFVLLLLLPDLSMIGYLADARIGAFVYNIFHAYVLPLVLIGIGHAASNQTVLVIGLIWLAHIGMDRMLGYGLKYPTAFRDTHLQRV